MNIHGKRTHVTRAPAMRMLWETAEKNMAAKLRNYLAVNVETLW